MWSPYPARRRASGMNSAGFYGIRRSGHRCRYCETARRSGTVGQLQPCDWKCLVRNTWAEVVTTIRDKRPESVGLVTSAAILDVGTVLDATPADMTRAFDVNVIGTALAIKAILPLMIERKGGPIVAVASVDATFAEQQLSVYAASKAAVRQLARTIAMDHARQGVRVNVLSPGLCSPVCSSGISSLRQTVSAFWRRARHVSQVGEFLKPEKWHRLRCSCFQTAPLLDWRGSDRRWRSDDELRLPHR